MASLELEAHGRGLIHELLPHRAAQLAADAVPPVEHLARRERRSVPRPASMAARSSTLSAAGLKRSDLPH